MTFVNVALLGGLLAVAIPVVIHLLNRRRFDVVDWGAMQFLHACQRRQRRILIDDWLLLALRALLIAILVLAAAGPLTRWNPLGSQGARPNRDIVIIVDGSASMSYVVDDASANDQAGKWVRELLRELRPGDRVAVLQARNRPVFAVPVFTSEFSQVEGAIAGLPKPAGSADWMAAVQQASHLLGTDGGRTREMVVLTDGQRHGWASPDALERWELLARGVNPGTLPHIWVVNVAPERGLEPPTAVLGPITASRPLTPVGREVRFQTELRNYGRWEKPTPSRVRIEVDGRPVSDVKGGSGERMPATFGQRFNTPGSHLVSAILDPAPVPGLSRQDYAIEVVPAVPVLIVDNEKPGTLTRRSDFLRDGLAPARDPEPSFKVRQLGIEDFTAQSLARPIGKEADALPRVLVLADVASLSRAQQDIVASFVQAGGGLLVTLGPNCNPSFWNGEPLRDGASWFPTRVGRLLGEEEAIEKAVKLVPASLEHPALSLFKDAQAGGLAAAYFPRHWKLEPAAEAGTATIASLTDRTPLLVEKQVGNGRVIVAAIPFDNSWRTNLVELGDFVRLTHELAYYLAAAKSGQNNLRPRQPIVFGRGRQDSAAGMLDAPGFAPRKVSIASWPFVFDDTFEPGSYKLTLAGDRTHYFAVQSDPNEGDLAPWSEADRQRLVDLLPTARFIANPNEAAVSSGGSRTPTDWTWLLLLAMIVLLGTELLAARRTLAANG